MVDMDRYREAADKAVAALREVHRLLDPLAERLEIPFEGTTMVGNLRGPRDAPLVVLLPGLDSTKEEFFEWENVFLRRGLATLSLDGPGQGETGYATNIAPNYEVAVAAALDHLGDRWTLLLLREAFFGVRRIGDFRRNTGAARNILSDRLARLVDAIGADHTEPPDIPEPLEEDEPWGSATPVPGSSVAMPSGYGPSRGRTTPGWSE
jgi:hypothetical protein